MNSLYSRLCAKKLLRTAWDALNKSNRHSFGIDQVTIEQFRHNLDHELGLIHDQLRHGSYNFSKLRGVTIPKPGSYDRRPIQIPAIRDRVVMKALAILIEPKLSAFNLPCSFAYIRGKSIHGAIARLKELANEGNHWVVEADISNFFGDVNQQLLLRRLHSVVGARSIFSILDSAIQIEIGNREVFEPPFRDLFPAATSGIPQGGILSPMLANFYLAKFDGAMLKRGFNLIRYADDFVVMCNSKDSAEAELDFARGYLKNHLGLKLQETKTRIVDYRGGFDFLGFRIAAGVHSPSRKSHTKLKEKISALADHRSGESLFPMLVRLKNVLKGWDVAYRDSELGPIPQDVNRHVVSCVCGYLSQHKLIPEGKKLRSKQIRMLGIPSLPVPRQTVRKRPCTIPASPVEKGRD